MESRRPVSVRGVILAGNRVVLLRSGRGERELPGGRLEVGEGVEECAAREILEEPNLCVEVGPLIGAWAYEPVAERGVLVLAYGCFSPGLDATRHSGEHSEVGLFGLDGLDEIPLPAGYARLARAWATHPAPTRCGPVGALQREGPRIARCRSTIPSADMNV